MFNNIYILRVTNENDNSLKYKNNNVSNVHAHKKSPNYFEEIIIKTSLKQI